MCAAAASSGGGGAAAAEAATAEAEAAEAAAAEAEAALCEAFRARRERAPLAAGDARGLTPDPTLRGRLVVPYRDRAAHLALSLAGRRVKRGGSGSSSTC